MAISLVALQQHVDKATDILRQQGRLHGHAPQAGVHEGQAVTVSPQGQSRAAARKNAQRPIAAQATVPLAQRRVRAEGSPSVMNPAQIAFVAASLGIPKAWIAQAARQILTGKGAGATAWRGSSRASNASARLLAHHVALNALGEEDVATRVGLLSPIGAPGESTEDQARRFQEAEDPDALDRLLQPLRELGIALPDKDTLWEQLLWVRHRPDELARWLDTKLSPVPADDLRRERERITDSLQTLSVDTGEGGQIAARTIRAAANVQDSAAQESDPLAFAATYVDVLEQPETSSYAQQLLSLLSRCRFEDINPTLGRLTTAVAEDVNGIDPSRDKALLNKRISDLGEMRLSSTTVAQMMDLVKLLGRTVFRDQPQKADPTRMLKELLTLIVRPATDVHSYLRYPEKLGITDVTTSIVVLGGVSRIVAGMHPKCFPGEQIWMDIRDAIQGALEELTVQEEDAAQSGDARQEH